MQRERGNRCLREMEITDGVRSVTLMSDLEFTITPKMIGVTQTMASGRRVTDYVGTKTFLTVPTGWLSADHLMTLRRMIREKHVLTVRYPDLDGDKIGEFFVEEPAYKAFKYDADGVTQWYGVTISMEAQEVER